MQALNNSGKSMVMSVTTEGEKKTPTVPKSSSVDKRNELDVAIPNPAQLSTKKLMNTVLELTTTAVQRVINTLGSTHSAETTRRALGVQLGITFLRSSPSVLVLYDQIITFTQSGLAVDTGMVDFTLHLLNNDMSTRASLYVMVELARYGIDPRHKNRVRCVAKQIACSGNTLSRVINVNFQNDIGDVIQPFN